MAELSPDVEVLVADWFRRARSSQRLHYECAHFFSRLNYIIGIPTVVLTAAVGTTVFATLTGASETLRLAVGLVSFLAAILATLHTVLAFAERAERHRLTATGYASVRRSLEFIKTFPPSDPHLVERALETVKFEMDALSKAAPEVPKRIHARIDAELNSRVHDRKFKLLPSRKDSPSPTESAAGRPDATQ